MGPMRPMLATRGEVVPTGENWTHEVKWDGMRVLADGAGAGLRLTSRTENDVTVAFPEFLDLAGRDVLLDGEVVAFADGIPSFGALQERLHVQRAARARILAQRVPVTLVVFDVLRVGAADLRDEPLSTRREALAQLDLDRSHEHVQVSPAYDDGPMLLDATRSQGLEGMVSKRLDSRYLTGQRSRHWLKFPHRIRESYVVGGWRPEVGAESRLGAILVGSVGEGDSLWFRGRVGSGIAGRQGVMLRDLLLPLERASSPFAEPVPRVDAAGTRWVEPVLVVEVESLGVSAAGRLRQPAYQGVSAQ